MSFTYLEKKLHAFGAVQGQVPRDVDCLDELIVPDVPVDLDDFAEDASELGDGLGQLVDPRTRHTLERFDLLLKAIKSTYMEKL